MKAPKRTCRPFDPVPWASEILRERAWLKRRRVLVPRELDWTWSRMLVLSFLRRSNTGFPRMARTIGTSATACRRTFDSFLRRTGLSRADYPRYCR